MNIRNAITTALAAMMMAGALSCTKLDFTNGLDKNGTNFAGDKAIADDDGDGNPNLYDTVPSVVTISFTGPDTVIIAKNDPKNILLPSLDDYSAMDDVYGAVPKDSIHLVGLSSIHTSQPGLHELTYSVTNRAGKVWTRKRWVIVDGSPPEITLTGANPMRLLLGTPYTDSGAVAIDDIDGNVTKNIKISGPNHVNQEGNDTVTYTVADRAGNEASQKRIVIVYSEGPDDKIPPVITLIGGSPYYIKEKQTYSEPGYTVTDNVDTGLTAMVIITGMPVNTDVPGRDTLTYSVQDKAKNKASVQRIIIIQPLNPGKDTLPPEITFSKSSPCTLKVGTPWTPPDYTAIDDVDGDVKSKVVPPTNSPNMNVPGVYTLYYSVSDNSNNKATYVFIVVVVGESNDKTKPVITLEGAAKCTVSVGKPFTDPGATATDDVDKIITSKITKVIKTVAGAPADFATFTSTIGDYVITYSVSDAAHNAADPVNRWVTVKDTTTIPAEVLLKKYGVPLSQALPSVDKLYSAVSVDGPGPSVATIKDFKLGWRNEPHSKGLDNFAMDLTVPPNYLDLQGKVKHTFDQPSPGFTLTGSGIAGLDGEYYINATAAQCVWVSKDGKFAIVFKP